MHFIDWSDACRRLRFVPRDSDAAESEATTQPTFKDLILSVQGATSLPQAHLLRRLACEVTKGVIIEIGAYRGRSTIALSVGSAEGHNAPVYAIDPHETFKGLFGGNFGPGDRRAFFKNMLRSGGWQNVRLVNLSSEVVTPGWQLPVGFLWIDGDHRYEAVKRDLDCWAPHLLPGAPIAFDDTDRGGAKKLVEELVEAGWTEVEVVGKVRVLVKPA